MSSQLITFPDNHILVRWANKIRAFYGYAVYLEGSALTKKNPKDYDIFCIIPDEDFELRYGNTKIWKKEYMFGEIIEGIIWGWAEDCYKKSINGMKFTKLNIDFKVIPQDFDNKVYERIRLDLCRP